MGPLLAAHWDVHGLMVLASSGATFHCREAVDGMWPCQVDLAVGWVDRLLGWDSFVGYPYTSYTIYN